jgi:hypothetical protein
MRQLEIGGGIVVEKRQPAGGLGPHRLERLLSQVGYFDEHLLGVPADTEQTAALADLVPEIARVIRVEAPGQVLVGPYPEIAISGDTAEDLTLYVGAPYLLGMPVTELKAVLAHAMASLGEPHPGLSDAMVRTTKQAQDMVALFSPATSLGRRYRKFLDKSTAFRDDLGRHADRAAAAMAGSNKQAQNALARAKVITEHFNEFAPRYLLNEANSFQDLYTHWLRAAAQPVPDWAVQSLRTVDPPVPAEYVALITGLDPDDADTLATAIDVDPDAAYHFGYDAIREEILTAATQLLGHDATPADVVALVADGRGAELGAQWDEVTEAVLADARPHTRGMERYLAETRTSASTAGELLEAFIAGLGVPRGYHYDPVVRPGALTAEEHSEIEIYATIGSAVAGDTAALAELVARLA